MASPFDDIFGGAGPQWTRDQIIARIRGEADAQKVDPDLAVAIATQESSLKPDNHGDNGKSRGLFHLQEKAAIDAGIDPKWRDDPGVNIYGGVRYLKQKLDQSGGNVEQALSRYNRGTPDYQGIGDPNYVNHVLRHYNPQGALAKQQPTLLQRAAKFIQPASAEAATPQQAQAASSPVWDDIFGAQQAAPGAAVTEIFGAEKPPQATTSPQPTPPVSQTAPAPQTPPGASQGPQMRLSLGDPQGAATEPEARATIEQMRARQMPPLERFLALPSIQSLTPEEREAAQQEFQAMKPIQQAEVIKMEQPGYWEQGSKRPGMTDEPPLEEGFTKPSTMIPLLMPGAGLKLVPGALKTAAPLLNRAVRAGAEGLSQTAGWTAGRTAETGEVPSPGAVGTEAALNVAAGGILEGLGAAGQAILRRSQGGKAIAAADEATTLARQEFAQAQAAAQQEFAQAKALAGTEQQAARTEAYQAAERKAREAQVRYQTKVEARDAKIAEHNQEYQEALTASKAEAQAEQARRYGQARTETMEETARAQARQQEYQQAVTGQEQALTQARAVPGKYTPQTPSWVQYEKFGDAAKDAVVDLTPAKAALADVRVARGVLPDGSVRPFPQAVESIATNLENATGETSFKTIREELRRLGPLTKSQDGNVRGAAKQLYGIYADVLEASPIANDLLKNANATFRKEMAVQDVAEWLTPGRGIVRIDNQGRETINVGALMTRLEKTVADDSLFRRSFAPDELDALRKDLRALAGTPTMPRGTMPPAAKPALLPGAAPNIPESMTPPTPKAIPPEVARPRVEMLPGGAGPGRKVALPQEPLPGEAPTPVTPREKLGERPQVFKDLTRTAMRDYLGTLFGIPGGLVMGANTLWRGGQQLRYGVARTLLSDSARPMMLRALQGGGTVSPRLYGTMVNALSDAERQALLRETREARERKR